MEVQHDPSSQREGATTTTSSTDPISASDRSYGVGGLHLDIMVLQCILLLVRSGILMIDANMQWRSRCTYSSLKENSVVVLVNFSHTASGPLCTSAVPSITTRNSPVAGNGWRPGRKGRFSLSDELGLQVKTQDLKRVPYDVRSKVISSCSFGIPRC
jgi:hypothetical protein